MPDNANTAHVQRRASLRVRAGIWMLFAVIGVGSLIGAGQLGGASPLESNPHSAVVAQTDPGSGAGNGQTLSQTTASARLVEHYTNGCENASGVAAVPGGKCDPFELLPTNRWQSSTSLFASYGWMDIPDSAQNSLASVLFSLAGLIWAGVFWFVEVVVGFNVFANTIGRTINDFFSSFAGGLIGGGILVIPAIIALLYAVSRALRGDTSGTFTVVIGAMMPVALLIGLTSFTSDSGGDENWTPPAGSPVWVAQTGVTVVDEVAGVVGDAMNATGATGVGTVSSNNPYAAVEPNCVDYTDGLRNSFELWRTENSPISSGSGSAISSLSQLWERAFLSQWVDAQYGGARAGSRIWCHQLEAQAATPRAVQVEAGIAAGYPSVDPSSIDSLDGYTKEEDADYWAALVAGGRYAPGAMRLNADGQPATTGVIVSQEQADAIIDVAGVEGAVLLASVGSVDRRDPYISLDESGKGYQASLFMWAGCVNNGAGWQAQAAWNRAGELSNNHCNAWYYGGLKPGEGEGGDDPKLEWGDSLLAKTAGSLAAGDSFSTDGGTTAAFDPASSDDLGDIRELVNAFRGDNSGTRIAAGFIALLTALAYAYVIGGLALGGLLAKVGVAVMLMLLPGTLVLLAFPNKGQGRNPAGVRLMRMTIGFLAASVFLTVALVLMVAMINIIEGLLSGFSGSFLSIFTPLIALFILRFILKRSGLGDLGSMRGQLGLTAAAGAAVAAKPGQARTEARRASRSAEGLPGPAAMKESAARRSEQARAIGGKAAAASRWTGAQLSDTKEKMSSRARSDAKAQSKMGALQSAMGADANSPSSSARSKAQLAALAATGAALVGADRAERDGEGKAAADSWGSKAAAGDMHSRGMKRLGAQDARALGRANADEARRAVAGKKPGEERNAALAAMMAGRADRIRAGGQVERDAAGNPLVDQNGQPIYGFTKTDAKGNTIGITAAEAGYDPKTGRARDGVSILNQPRRDLSELEAGAARDTVAANLGLDARQVLGSTDGLPPVPALRTATASDLTRIPVSDSFDANVEMARDAVHWIPEEFKQRLNAADLSETSRNRAVHQLMVAAGGIDTNTMQRVDFAAANGINLDTAEGAAELEKHLAGKPSAFDSVQASVSGIEFTRILGDATTYDRQAGGGASYSTRQVPVLLQTRELKATDARANIGRLDGYRAEVARVGELGARIEEVRSNGDEPAEQLLSQYNTGVSRLSVMVPDVVRSIGAARGDAAVLSQIDLVTTKAARGHLGAHDVNVIEAAVSGFDAGEVQLQETIGAAQAQSPEYFVSVLGSAIDDTLMSAATSVLHAPSVEISSAATMPRSSQLVAQRAVSVPKVAAGARRVVNRNTSGTAQEQLSQLLEALSRDAESERSRQYAEQLRDRARGGDSAADLIDAAYAAGHGELAEGIETATKRR